MNPRYSQSYAPPGRRVVPPERQTTGGSDYSSSSYEPSYRRSGRESFSSSRGSGTGVIPISTETYVDGRQVSSTRNNSLYDNYSDRSSRSSFSAGSPPRRAGTASTPMSSLSSRLAPTIVYDSGSRPMSTLARPAEPYERDRDYVAIPASSKPIREHKKVFSVDDNRGPRLVHGGDRDGLDRVPVERPRRESIDAKGRAYHLSGPRNPTGVDNESGFEYTDPRGMYDSTEPRWRPRTGSVGRERPSSMYETYDLPKAVPREAGPPPVTRGLDRIRERTGSMHEAVRSPPRDRNRAYYSQDDKYDISPVVAKDRAPYPERNDAYPPFPDIRRERDEYDDPREPRTMTRRYEDREVASRGFGIRTSSVDAAQRAYPRGSFSVDPVEREPPRREVLETHPIRDEDVFDEFERPRDRDRYPTRDRDREESGYHGREKFREREDRDIPRDRERELIREPDRGFEPERRPRDRESDRELDREPERMRYPDHAAVSPREDLNIPKNKEIHDRARDDEKQQSERKFSTGMAGAGAAGAVAAAAAASYAAHEHRDRKGRDRAPLSDEDDSPEPPARAKLTVPEDRAENQGRTSTSPDPASSRERHAVKRDDHAPAVDVGRDRREPEIVDPDEEYRRRMQQEVEKLRKSQPAPKQEDDVAIADSHRRERREQDREDVRGEQAREVRPGREERRDRPEETALAVVHEPDRHDSILESAIVDEPEDMPAAADRRVGIVEPPKEKAAPKSILRKPTEKFPDYPNATREGVAPLKDSKKADIPEGAKWTKISRDLINPAALLERNERFEERRDVVIVLRVLTKEEVQEFADRTREIRLEREHQRDRRRHRHRRDAADEDHDDDDSR